MYKSESIINNLLIEVDSLSYRITNIHQAYFNTSHVGLRDRLFYENKNISQRLNEIFSILVNRLGKRCGKWCELPFRLTHERIGELIGSTRVTSTRLISKLRSYELLIAPIGTQTVSVDPSFIEDSPL